MFRRNKVRDEGIKFANSWNNEDEPERSFVMYRRGVLRARVLCDTPVRSVSRVGKGRR